ncbi:thioesterase II family protein [Solwaraspora sp. WMMB335]|uniref:thioesterase II family protein n=1 Tax=Solwaraspora sp. WMMB335 TaxID=3404118 RepID=UPI003B947892
MSAARSEWFPRVRRRDTARVRLVCLGGAGTGSSEFAGWQAALPGWVEVWAAQLPGRERRIRQAPARTMIELADPLAEELRGVADGTPWALFGHSFGALVAYEVGCRVRACGLVVASAVVPHLQATRLPVAADDDETLLDWARNADGTDPDLLADPRFARWLAEDLRVTLRIRREYPTVPPRPLPIPVLAVGGAGDPDAAAADLERWREYTTGEFTRRQIGHGHFFLRDERESLLAVMVEQLDRWTGGNLS